MRTKKHDNNAMHYIPVFGILLLLATSPVALRAQLSTASINGTVRDTSGAVIPGVSIVLHNTETGVNQRTITNAAGNYVLLNIPPGRYHLQASKQGFSPAAQSSILLTVNQTATFNFTLKVGLVTQSVTVQVSPVRVEASTAELGTAITRREVDDLPLNGRNFTQLLALTPGVSTLNTSQNSTTDWIRPTGAYTIPAINGQGNRSNLFLLDGINNEGSQGSTYAVQPIVDDIEEFKVDSHNDQAQFGSVMGGVINIATKSGTNQFHGTLWEFMRNTSFDARDPFLKSVTPYTQNQFGGNAGGPVILPHYNGRNRTFFFFGIEQFINHTAGQSVFLDPTPAEFSGDFSAVSQPIYNPFSTRPDPNKPGKFLRDPFPDNRIPTSLLDPHTLAYKSLYPAPVANTGVAGLNGLVNTPSITDALGYDLRVDQQLGAKNSFWFRFSRYRNDASSTAIFLGEEDAHIYPAYNLGVNWLHTFSPTAILEAQFGRVNAWIQSSSFISGAPDIAAGFSPGFACGFGGPKSCIIPRVSLTGYGGGGESLTLNNSSDIYLGKASLSLIRGKHTLSIGGEINSNPNYSDLDTLSIGFTPFATSNLETSAGGNALASFLLGVPASAERRNRVNNLTDGWVDSLYFQDQWKATKRLTVNLGARYDVTFLPILQPSKTQSQMSGGIDFNNGTYIVTKAVSSLGSCATLGQAPCIPGGVLPAHVVVGKSQALVHNTYNNIQPRVGLAYALNDKTALRASFGMFTDNWAAMQQLSQNYGGLWPSVGLVRAANLNSTVPTVTAEDPLGLGTKKNPLPAANPFKQVAFFTAPNSRNPYSEQWNLGVERQLGSTTLLAANYVGSHSSALSCCDFYNTALTPGAGSPESRAPYPYIVPTHYDRSVGSGNYNALQLSLKKSASRGLSYLISYTWSKAMNTGCDGYFGVEGCDLQNPYDPRSGYSVAGFDATHVFTASWVYELPFGKGQRFATGNGPLDFMIGGWRFNGIATLRSGAPYTVTYSGDVANTGNNVQLVNIIGNPNLPNPTTAEWINTAAFQAPAAHTWGNIGRNTLRSDWFKDFDLSVFRDFSITESKYLEFRAEAFNAFNWPTWSAPTATFNSPNFGEVFGTASTPRQFQFALKFYF